MGELTTAQNWTRTATESTTRWRGLMAAELTDAQNDADGDGVNDEVARLMGELTEMRLTTRTTTESTTRWRV